MKPREPINMFDLNRSACSPVCMEVRAHAHAQVHGEVIDQISSGREGASCANTSNRTSLIQVIQVKWMKPVLVKID